MSKQGGFSTPPKKLIDSTKGTSNSEEKRSSIANQTATTISEHQNSLQPETPKLSQELKI